MIWGFMVQLGHNMWGELPLDGDAPKAGREHMFAHDFNRTDVDMWDDVTEYYARKGANLVLIDLGEGLQYPSHPELAVKGSWSPERMKEELVRLKGLGLEPILKLNFSACHDAWLKDYSRKASFGSTICSSRRRRSKGTSRPSASRAARQSAARRSATWDKPVSKGMQT